MGTLERLKRLERKLQMMSDTTVSAETRREVEELVEGYRQEYLKNPDKPLDKAKEARIKQLLGVK